jgi:hypothetical protein
MCGFPMLLPPLCHLAIHYKGKSDFMEGISVMKKIAAL